MIAFGHPRIGVGGGIGRPSIAVVDKGALVTWTDDHERAGHDHAYAVVVDDAARPLSRPRDLTPEADDVMRPSLLASGGRVVLLYNDKSGHDAGVRVRWIDGDGRIAGASSLIGAGRAGTFWPSIGKAPDGFFVAWQDDRDKEGDDIFLRKLATSLDPVGTEIRASDYASVGGHAVNARVPDVAIAADALLITYKLERETSHTIVRMRIPLSAPELGKGLDERGAHAAPAPVHGKGVVSPDRELGEVALVNDDKTSADAPSIGCGSEGCFVAWASDHGGANAALLDPDASQSSLAQTLLRQGHASGARRRSARRGLRRVLRVRQNQNGEGLQRRHRSREHGREDHRRRATPRARDGQDERRLAPRMARSGIESRRGVHGANQLPVIMDREAS